MGVGMAIMFWLTPHELGMWNAVSIFLAYGPFFQLGIQSGLNVELPILLGKEDHNQAERYVANAFGYAIILSILFLILGAGLSIWFYFFKGIYLALGVATITIMSICTSFQLHLVARFRSAKTFDKLSRIFLVETVAIVLLVWFIYKYHYFGILIYNVVVSLVGVLMMFYFAPYPDVKPVIHKKTILSLGKIGVALMFFVQLKTATQTLPKWIIIAKAGIAKLGLYSPAIAINGLISLIPNQVAQFFHPQMGYIYGQTGKAKDIWPYAKKMFILLPIATLPLSIGIWIFSPWLLDTFFPKYTESFWAMRIMAVAFTFSCAGTMIQVLNTLKAFKYVYISAGIDFVGAFLYPYLMTEFTHLNILEAVTVGLAINSFINYWLYIVFLRRVLFLPKYN